MRKNRLVLLTALGTDNFGSGLFLPLALVYVIRVVGLALGTAGTVVALGTAVGLGVPPVAGRLVDRIGPRPVVTAAQLLQALGALAYLAARGAPAVAVAAVLLAAGQQMFYCSVFALIGDVAGDGPKDRPFTVAGMVRSACFGLGGLAAGALLSLAGPAGYRIAVGTDAASFVACALLLALLLRLPRSRPRSDPAARTGSRGPLSDRPFLALIAITALVALATDFFLAGIGVYAITRLRAPPWLPGASLALLTALTSTGGTVALRATRHITRTTAMALGAALYVLWCGASLAATVVPPPWRPPELLAASLVEGAAGLLFSSRVNALAEATAPRPMRGRYLAAFQYAFTVPGVIAPGVVALFSVAVWLPWLVVGTCAAVAAAALRRLASRLPAAAVRPPPTEPRPARRP